MKKSVALILAVAMIFAQTVGVYADSTSANAIGQSAAVEQSAAVAVPTIQINIETTGDVYCNPYKMAVASAANSTDSLIGSKITLENASDVKVSVGIKGMATPSSNEVKLGTDLKTVQTTTTAKLAYIQATVSGGVAKASLATGGKALRNAKDTKNLAPLVYGTKDVALEEDVTLAAGTGTQADTTHNCILINITGATSVSDKAAWTANDGLKLKTTFDIKGATGEVSKFESTT